MGWNIHAHNTLAAKLFASTAEQSTFFAIRFNPSKRNPPISAFHPLPLARQTVHRKVRTIHIS
jgi:hypothetical protein